MSVSHAESTTGVLIVPAAKVRTLLPMAQCIDAVQKALVGVEKGSHQQPLRFGWKLPQVKQE